ncbi:MAG: hypothetical protein DCF29_00400 [Alphaproteobacteria bacterium]|uniref:hypothetical protein n=1 Tax=Brevundimonas sp. BAL3 TaxID=391600 RepID=UPI0009FD4B9E|nr:hypothetical protein [Brevundimonas sp. BAL3]PZO09106.1 MAG: hypothetical protein DCF29_00400 [Alphaproteobacteria bacterium]
MQKLTALRLIMRFGAVGSILLAALAALAATILAWPGLGWGGLAVGLVVAPLAWLALKSYVELVSIIFQTVH